MTETATTGTPTGTRRVAVERPGKLRGTIVPPGDKSVSHRSVMLNAVADGVAHVTNFSTGADCASTIECFRALGVRIDRAPGSEQVTVHGVGMDGLKEPDDVLDAGNSGTTLRLMSGLLAGRPFQAVVTGDESLRSRPMERIIKPLTQMGAHIHGRKNDRNAPLVFSGGSLHGIEYQLPVASAQVKSCILLAGLRAEGTTVAVSPALSRDHTERMLSAMGAPVNSEGLAVSVTPSRLKALDVDVPGDVSSAAFWMVAGAVHPDAEIRINNVGLNPTRTGVIDVLREMGASIDAVAERTAAGEPVADLVVRSSGLHGVEIGGEIIPSLIDEIPVLAVAAAVGSGQTVIRDASELRAKETDRIMATVKWLRDAGVPVDEREDGLTITGIGQFPGVLCDSFGDHRIAMAQAVAGMVSNGPMRIAQAGAVVISYPSFWKDLSAIGGRVSEASQNTASAR